MADNKKDKKEQNFQVGYYKGIELKFAQNVAGEFEKEGKRVELNEGTFEVFAFDVSKK